MENRFWYSLAPDSPTSPRQMAGCWSKSDGSDLGESIGLLDANYVWQGIINESPEDLLSVWGALREKGMLTPIQTWLKTPIRPIWLLIFLPLAPLQIPRFENSEKCRDTRRWGAIEVGDAPVWVEDDRIAFYSYKGADGIYIANSVSLLREAGGLAPSQPLVGSNGRPTDTFGSQLFFSAGDIDGNWEAYAVDLDGSNLTNLSNAPLAQDGLPTVSP